MFKIEGQGGHARLIIGVGEAKAGGAAGAVITDQAGFDVSSAERR